MHFLFVISGLLNIFWGCAHLVMALRNDIFALLASVEHVTGLLEVVFHHIDVVIVVLKVNAGIPDQKNAEFVKTFGHFLTFETNLIG